MEIKMIMAANAYKILKSLKTGEMSDETLMSVWKDINSCQPIALQYEEEFSTAMQELQNAEFAEMQTKLQALNQKKSQKDYVLSEEDKEESLKLNEYFNKIDTEAKKRFSEISQKTFDIEIEKLETKDFLKATKHSDMTMEGATILSWIFK